MFLRFLLKMITTKVCIIGAGPGGATTALQLNKLNIDCVLIDKAYFPRDKVCGDALSAKVISCLQKIDPAIIERFQKEEAKLDSWGIRFVSPARNNLDAAFLPNLDAATISDAVGYVSKRLDFDNFLISEVKRCSHVKLLEGIAITDYKLLADGYLITDADGFSLKANLLIVANGAHSAFTKNVAQIQMEPKHYSAGLRAYYTGVTGMHKNNFIELHFLKNLLPGYFWIFPLPNGAANVGLGMPSDVLHKKKLNLKKKLLEIIKEDEVLKHRFKNAALAGSIVGYGLPLASKKRSLSGERFMLVGDAGSLIDPFTGEGIGNAMKSGYLAAAQAAEAIKANDFSKESLQHYDSEVYRVFGTEFRLSTRIQKLVKYPKLFNFIINVSARNKKIQELFSCMFFDMNIRKQLTKPSFYIKLLFNK